MRVQYSSRKLAQKNKQLSNSLGSDPSYCCPSYCKVVLTLDSSYLSFRCMIIRKLLLSAVAFAAISTTSLVFAQQGKGANSNEAAMARLEPLALTAAQKTKIEAILAKSAAAVAALPQDERRTKGGEIRQASNKEIRAVLTPDQQKKFDALPPMTGGKKKN